VELTTCDGAYSEGSPAGRLLRRGLLAAVLATVTNALLLMIASSLFGAVVVPPGEALSLGPVVVASAIGAIGAAVVFGVIGRFSRRPIRVFRATALVVLLLSLAPIPLQGVAGPSAGALALMHVLAAAIVVGRDDSAVPLPGVLTTPPRG
jgi:Family of unknown function (DUF6069)